jgi:site-specific DNA-adenine methylase
MTVPQPFQYQGSKRALAPLILQYLPVSTTPLPACAVLRRGFQVEPFCGSAALSIATAARGRANFEEPEQATAVEGATVD